MFGFMAPGILNWPFQGALVDTTELHSSGRHSDKLFLTLVNYMLPWTTIQVKISKCCCLSASVVPRMLWQQSS